MIVKEKIEKFIILDGIGSHLRIDILMCIRQLNDINCRLPIRSKLSKDINPHLYTYETRIIPLPKTHAS